nr:restriction endonuclease subunit S [uncultured Neisseria sp.]
MNKQQEPRLRFKGFTGAWEEKKLEDIFNTIRNAFVGTATPYYVENGHFYLESNNIKNGEINKNSQIFINDEFYYKQQDKWLKTNDLVMVQSGHVGHCAVIPEELNNVAAHALIMFSNYKSEANPYFLSYQFQTNSKINEIAKITTGNTIKHILSSDMKEFVVDFPMVEEQIQLGNFFRRLDSQIAESRAVLEKSRQLKKAMLAKMFPANGEKIPKIRFKGFEGEWEEKNFESVGEFNPKTEIPSIFQYVDLESVVGTQLISYREESKETAPSRAQRLAKNGDLFFQAVRPYQKNNYLFEKNNENFVFSTGYIQIRPQNDGYFLLTLVQKEEFVQEVLLRCTGTSYPAINASSLQDIAILTPQTSKEQIAIGNFFRQLDETIALQSAEIEKLNQLKKGLLAAMLV